MFANFVQVSLLFIVALAYAAFDVFNKRNVPNLFVYGSIVLGIAVAIVYSYSMLLIVGIMAVVVLALGYVVYKFGYLGAGDVAEFMFVVLAMPIQQQPLLFGPQQFGMPFILSVFVAAGYSASLFVPIYYLWPRKENKKSFTPSRRGIISGGLLFLAYLLLMAALWFVVKIHLNLIAIILILMVAISSAIMLIYEKKIYMGMVAFIYPNELEEEDMIAINMMDEDDLNFFKSKMPDFGRLVTTAELKVIHDIKRKVPVYRNSVPFALFLFIGIVISLAFGNIVLYLIS
jgi:Flp pilus assembly protein protease CpaA